MIRLGRKWDQGYGGRLGVEVLNVGVSCGIGMVVGWGEGVEYESF